jgi:hypothetical protein
MSALGPPRKKAHGKLGSKTAREIIPLRFYAPFAVLQARRTAIRRCVCFGAVVTNRSLGGFDGRNALTGRLWCLHCC